MRISSAPVAAPNPLTYGRIDRTTSSAPASAGAAVKVETSGFLSQLTAAAHANPYGDVRTDKVAAAKADLAAGRLGSAADIEQTIDAFLQALV